MAGIILKRKDGLEMRTIGRAWWTSHALEVEPGRIEVARIEAESTTLKRPSEEDVKNGKAENTWTSDDVSVDYTGDFVGYSPGLTEEELRINNLTPGILKFPDVVDGTRPQTNRSDKPSSICGYRKMMHNLQNEGYSD